MGTKTEERMHKGAQGMRSAGGAGASLVLVGGALRAPAAAQCVGDCNVSGTVTVDKLIVAVNIALGAKPLAQCASLDVDANGAVTVDELVRAVANALQGCPIVPVSAGIVFNAE